MKLKYQLAIQEIAGSYMAVAVGDDARKFKHIINTNATGMEILKMMENETSTEAMVQELMHRYEADEETIRASVNKIINTLTAFDALI